MNSGKLLGCLFFSVLLLSGCDDKEDEFSGLSDLVRMRQGIRKTISRDNARKKDSEKQGQNIDPQKVPPIDRVKQKKEISSIVLYEKNIEVVDSTTGSSLAKGIAYMNKDGRIIKIKITKE